MALATFSAAPTATRASAAAAARRPCTYRCARSTRVSQKHTCGRSSVLPNVVPSLPARHQQRGYDRHSQCLQCTVSSSAPCPPEGCLEEIELKDLVKQNSPITISMNAQIFEALEVLVENGISGMPVVDENGAVVGSVSGYDLLALESTPGSLDSSDGMFPKLGRCDEFNGRKKDMWSYFLETQERLEKADGQTVGEIMHRATLVPPDMMLGDAADLIVQRKLQRLCIVNEKDQCTGVVSRGDIMRATLRNYRWQKQRLAAQNSGLDQEI